MGKPVLGTKNRLTYTELHAVILGGVVGGFAGYAHAIGRTTVATAFAALFVALSWASTPTDGFRWHSGPSGASRGTRWWRCWWVGS
jgi:hypothetical protein